MSKQPLRKNIPIGSKYSRWTLIADLGIIGGYRRVFAKCDCGTQKEVSWQNIKSGKSPSCGCIAREAHTKHGLHKHPLYSVWEGMVARCYNINYRKYHRYGGRGVKMCDEWRNDFKSFYDWAINNGWKKGLSLDKDKLSSTMVGDIYSPEYCCFITSKENSMYRKNSKVIEYNGESMCVAQWAEKFNIKYPTFQGRLLAGWTIEEIISTLLVKYNKKEAA